MKIGKNGNCYFGKEYGDSSVYLKDGEFAGELHCRAGLESIVVEGKNAFKKDVGFRPEIADKIIVNGGDYKGNFRVHSGGVQCVNISNVDVWEQFSLYSPDSKYVKLDGISTGDIVVLEIENAEELLIKNIKS